MIFLQLLVDKGLLTAPAKAKVEQAVASKTPLRDALAAEGLKLEDALAAAGQAYGLPARILGDPPASQEAIRYIPIDSARHYGIVPLAVADGALEVGITDPDNLEAMDALQFISSKVGLPYKIFLITREDFDRVVENYGSLSGEVGRALSEYDTTPAGGAAPAGGANSATQKQEAIEEVLDLSGSAVNATIKEDAPVTKIVSSFLRYAIDGKASDVHIEPTTSKTRVRFRTDGELKTALELPTKVHEALVARVKILALLRLDEKRKPQDGRFSAMVDGRRIDFRVSTFPTEYGEKVVMRILDQSASSATLDTVGLSKEGLASVRAALNAPFGIILMAGPTGSGKSTTLFTMLSEVDRETQNVVSLEDPVEYQIPGVAQSQVRPEIGYTFASGLRSILRQDPDVIMVGEIRDKETAALAVQAALTGHLVLSTIHTNTAAGAIPRLLDMGVDPYLIAPTLVSVIGQRLVRQICPGGGKAFPITASHVGILDKQFADLPQEFRLKLPQFKQFYHAVPTPEFPSGTKGRTGVFEVLKMSKALEDVILKSPVEEKVFEVARVEGMLTMREHALIKAAAGEIPFEEVNTLGGALSTTEEPS